MAPCQFSDVLGMDLKSQEASWAKADSMEVRELIFRMVTESHLGSAPNSWRASQLKDALALELAAT